MPSNESISINEEKEVDILSSLLQGNPFKLRPDNEKIEIIKKGKPLPELYLNKKDDLKGCDKPFDASSYSIYNWLCGSQSYNKLFCWPCVLMRPETSSWCSTGNDDVKRLPAIATKHSACKSHQKAVSEYDDMLKALRLPREPGAQGSDEGKGGGDDEDEEEEEEDSFFDQSSTDASNAGKNVKRARKLGGQRTNNQTSLAASVSQEGNANGRSKITFKAWKTISRDVMMECDSSGCLASTLHKWRRKIAKQELKNARLNGEKIKIEIEMLKAKAEYYKSLKEKMSPEEAEEGATDVKTLTKFG